MKQVLHTDLQKALPVVSGASGKTFLRYMSYMELMERSKAEQNISTIFIIDKDGIVQFKYHSQQTQDRPGAQYLLDFIKKMK